jgi:hypothetical protein
MLLAMTILFFFKFKYTSGLFIRQVTNDEDIIPDPNIKIYFIELKSFN